MKRALRCLGVVAGGAALVGLVVAAAGLVPIAASSGHWALTSWFLHFTMRQSVQTHARGIEVPSLDRAAIIERGAGHYHTGCAACHGAPGEAQPRVAEHMTPQPPYLPPRIESWQANELFWIVKHGVKYTGMPAWPAPHRDDEVWSVVAFLLQLPQMSPQRYERLALGPAHLASPETVSDRAASAELKQSPQDARDNCGRCHGRRGEGRASGAFPRLAGQSRQYLMAALNAYASGLRLSGIMQPVAQALDEQQRAELATHYAEIQGATRPDEVPREAALIERGRRIAHQGVGTEVAVCVQCHGPAEQPRKPDYPVLDGQFAPYLRQQLRLFQAKHGRGGAAYAHVMDASAHRLSAEQIDAVAAYYASRPPP